MKLLYGIAKAAFAAEEKLVGILKREGSSENGMKNRTEIIRKRDIARLIYSLRDQRVILDSDLARIYQVPTKALNQAVKRNRGKFPNDFVFEVSPREAEDLRRLRSQFVTLKTGRGQHRKYLPYAFTEHGALMAATVLRDDSDWEKLNSDYL